MFCRKTFEELLNVNSPVKPFSFAYDGKPCDLSKVPCVIEPGGCGNRKMIYEVIPGTVRLTLEMTVWPDFPVIEYTPYLENIGKTDSGIISDLSVLDYEAEDTVGNGVLNLNDQAGDSINRIRVRYLLGSKASESDFLPQYRDLYSRPGCSKLELECACDWCSSDYLPFFGVDNDPMNGMNLAIGWSGGWKFSAEREIESDILWTWGRKSRIRCGMKRTFFRLHPGEKLMQPGILLHFREGKSIRDGQNEFRRFMIAHHAPRNSRGEVIKPPICLALWGGLETDQQIQRIQTIQSEHLPYEEIWIDAGWMGSPGPSPHPCEGSKVKPDWPIRVGSWDFNTWAHPNGLKPIADAAHRAGMRLMVWFESLRVHSFSGAGVIKEHPEWLLGDHAAASAGKPVNFILNIGIPEAWQYLFDTITGIMEREGIDDYREDFNMEGHANWELGDEPDRIGVTEMKFVEACYRFWEELRKRHPDMFVDNCSSGGRRLDYKAASLSFPLCQSDFACPQIYEEECVQLENLYLDDWLPLHGTLNWGEADPYHAFSGLGCGFGSKIWQFNGRGPKPDYDYNFHSKVMQWGKQLRNIHLTGDVYPLVEAPEEDWRKWNGQQIHNPKENCGMIQLFRRKKSPDSEFQLKLAGLDPDAIYETAFFTGEIRQLSGWELASLVIHLEQPRSFQIIRYKLVKNAAKNQDNGN